MKGGSVVGFVGLTRRDRTPRSLWFAARESSCSFCESDNLMSRVSMSLRVLASCFALSLLLISGCKEKPEVDFSEYGETIPNLPVVKDLPRYFPIEDELETKECTIREETEERTERELYSSQGRAQEYSAIEAERAQARRQQELEERAERERKLRELEEQSASSDESKPADVEPAAEQPTAEQPTAEQPTAEEPAPEEPAAEQPAPEQPTAEQPAE